MLKKIYNICFIVCFFGMLLLPLVKTNWKSGGVSEDENRNLAGMSRLIVDGKFNDNVTAEFENWFRDHMGYRIPLINLNAKMQFEVFDRLLEKSLFYLGKDGDLIYATKETFDCYAHLDIREEEDVKRIGDGFQIVSDWIEEKGIQFYYVQCYDKHSIYPEQFLSTINQIGDTSKVDQMINYLEEETDVNVVSLKDVLLESKDEYEVYSNWGDPSHWSPRGAYIGYKHIMQVINENNNNAFKILEEKDYNITESDQGLTLNGSIHQEDILESFEIIAPAATEIGNEGMGAFSDDIRHSVWKNEEVDNDITLLLICDSYINSFIVDDFAESFSEVWLIRVDYTERLEEAIELCNPDIIIYECVERAEKSDAVYALAEIIK